MRTSRAWLAISTPLAVIAALSPAAIHAEVGDPVAQIGAYDDAVAGVVRAKLGLAQRAARFEPIVRAHYDMPAIAALVVGPAWATASTADKAGAITALTRHSAVSLARNFTGGDIRFTVDPKVIDRAGSKVVKVTIGSDTLFYRLQQAGGAWKIVDVISGGVSQLALQRADLAGTIRTGGIDAMIKRLGQLDAMK